MLYIAYKIHQNKLILYKNKADAKYVASTNNIIVTLASSNPFMYLTMLFMFFL